jgi:hypothetical protein
VISTNHTYARVAVLANHCERSVLSRKLITACLLVLTLHRTTTAMPTPLLHRQ